MNDNEQIDMSEAIEILGITQPTFYRWLREGRIQGTKVGRRWRFLRDDIERLSRGETAGAAAPNGTGDAVVELLRQIKNVGGHSSARSDDPVDDLVDAMIYLGVAIDATDLHLEPQSSIGRMRFRVDGALQEIITLPNDVLDACVQNWKGKAHCDVRIKDLPQDGRINMTLHDDKKMVIRISVVPTTLGESITIRFLVEENVTVDINRIPFAPEHRARIDHAINGPFGLIIVTGPTGCGKTTTLYSIVNELATPENKIMSVEDPVEFILPGVNQLQAKDKGMTFGHAIRACLRSDPDVLMVGELRDREVITMVHQAALTGILVLTAMHTMDAVSAIMRLRDVGIDAHLIADALQLIVAQRLVRKLCPHCAKKVELDKETRDHYYELARQGGLDPMSLQDNWHDPVGCDKCNGLGYRGRTVVNETIEIGSELRRAIINEASEEELNTIAREAGYCSLAVDAIRRAANGETSLQELRILCSSF